jgi:hypothetical protein
VYSELYNHDDFPTDRQTDTQTQTRSHRRLHDDTPGGANRGDGQRIPCHLHSLRDFNGSEPLGAICLGCGLQEPVPAAHDDREAKRLAAKLGNLAGRKALSRQRAAAFQIDGACGAQVSVAPEVQQERRLQREPPALPRRVHSAALAQEARVRPAGEPGMRVAR